jgi:hypothetical protein
MNFQTPLAFRPLFMERVWGGDRLAKMSGKGAPAGAPIGESWELVDREAEQSVNFVSCHDGFTLNDLVSYNQKHNEANGEDNRDGSNDDRSWNCGVEGPTADPSIEALRNRQVKNFFAMSPDFTPLKTRLTVFDSVPASIWDISTDTGSPSLSSILLNCFFSIFPVFFSLYFFIIVKKRGVYSRISS